MISIKQVHHIGMLIVAKGVKLLRDLQDSPRSCSTF